ncbi:hypothetical protein [Modestobacter italicus]|uniref:hypothetical protein n=1 Tax=Modestobacter italicus (strain DSM 44449 / CECT 9708 / BC 501) TaxID=2732864 RepID=UPI001C95C599|nr:hypothetical protein [Modestobacter italicus]
MTEADAAGTRPPSRVTSSPRHLPPPPPRPPTSSDLAPPAPYVVPPAPRTVRTAAWAWCAASVAGLVALATAALDLAGLRQRLVDSAATADPAAEEELLREGADTTVLAVLGPLAALIVLGALCLVLYLRRRSRWGRGLLVLGVLTVVVDVLAQDLLTGGPEIDRIAAIAQGGLIALALVLLLLPPSRAWSREPRG